MHATIMGLPVLRLDDAGLLASGLGAVGLCENSKVSSNLKQESLKPKS